MKAFASDNWAPACPEVMEALIEANQGHSPAYGDDDYTKKANEVFKKHFGEKAETYFVFNGTAANIISLATATNSFNAILCSEHAHINIDECGAPENFSGTKLIGLPNNNGKITIEQIEKYNQVLHFPHQVIPKLISISQATEYGTLYSNNEIKEIADYAHSHNLYLHVDGARIANAAAALETDFKTMITDTGVDILSFGGTKNGVMFGEAVVILNNTLKEYFELYRKQGMQLASKMRYISAQFTAIMQNDVWRKNAQHANSMALLLASALSKYQEIQITQTVEVNGLWVRMKPEIAEKLQSIRFFHPWNIENNEYRIMTSWDTREKDVEDFVKALEDLELESI